MKRSLFSYSFHTLNQYPYKLGLSWKSHLKTFLIAVNCKECLRIRSDEATAFISMTGLPKILLLVLLINFSVDSAMSPIMVNVSDIWMLELVNILLYHHLPKKQVKPKNSYVADHLLFCNHSAFYDNFSILMHENKEFYWNWEKAC